MTAQILSGDWGTSSFRLRLINLADGRILAETREGKGIAALHQEWLQFHSGTISKPDFFRSHLQQAIDRLPVTGSTPVPVILSGMASSSIGMLELPYHPLPFDLTKDRFTMQEIPADLVCTHPITLVSGLRTANDVMRGEETILLGCDRPAKGETLILFPGTHSKHVRVKDGVLLDFKTYMTGEVFDLLASKSILSASVTKPSVQVLGKAFSDGLTTSSRDHLLHTAFTVRTNQLFGYATKEDNYQYLSGLLIGAELQQISDQTEQLILVAGNTLSEGYEAAIKALWPTIPLAVQDADQALVNAHLQLAKF